MDIGKPQEIVTIPVSLPTLPGATSGVVAGGQANASSLGAGSGLTESTADVPILAFKRCRLRWQPGGRLQLISTHTRSAVKLDEDAACHGHAWGFSIKPEPPHTAPHLGCSCGFYAVSDPENSEGYGTVLLDVELSGRVIVHERGYRAGHQRILRARTGGCHYCGEPVTAFAVDVKPESPPVNTAMVGSFYYTFGRPSDDDNVRALCDAHVKPDDVTIAPHIVAARLGIPFECEANA